MKLGIGEIALGLGALYLLSRNGTSVPSMTQQDYKFLESSQAKQLAKIMAEDETEWFYTSQGNTPRSAEETAVLLAKLKTRYVDNLELGQLNVPTDVLSNALLALLDMEDVSVRTATLDTFVSLFNTWNILFTNACVALGTSLAQILEQSGAAINNANECTEWTWVKNQELTNEQSSTAYASVRKTGSSFRVGLGILGSGGRQTTFSETMQSSVLKEGSKITFVPHCTATQLNIAAVESVLIAQAMAIKPLYAPVQAVINMQPTLKLK